VSRRAGTQSLYGFAEKLPPRARRLWELAREEAAAWPTVRADAERLRAVKARHAQRFFAGAAGAWRKLRAEVYGARVDLAAILALLPPGWTVADLGCGTGALSAELAPAVARVVAVDQSAAMLATARSVLSPFPNVEIHEAPLEALPIPDGSCDAAVASLVLAYLDHPAPVLAEAFRILRPGGTLVVLEAARHDDPELRRRLGQAQGGFEPAALVELAARAGFAEPSARALPPEPGAKGPGLVILRATRPAAARHEP
jgi:SAM-dependent methyltransferase